MDSCPRCNKPEQYGCGCTTQEMNDWRADEITALRARLEAVEAAQIMLKAERDGLASLLLSVQRDSIAAEAALATARRDAAIHIYTMEHDGTKPEWIGQGAWAYAIEQASHRAMQAPIRALAAQEPKPD